jgi:hypothetical protein
VFTPPAARARHAEAGEHAVDLVPAARDERIQPCPQRPVVPADAHRHLEAHSGRAVALAIGDRHDPKARRLPCAPAASGASFELVAVRRIADDVARQIRRSTFERMRAAATGSCLRSAHIRKETKQ